jgi:hypothetical protein
LEEAAAERTVAAKSRGKRSFFIKRANGGVYLM